MEYGTDWYNNNHITGVMFCVMEMEKGFLRGCIRESRECQTSQQDQLFGKLLSKFTIWPDHDHGPSRTKLWPSLFAVCKISPFF